MRQVRSAPRDDVLDRDVGRLGLERDEGMRGLAPTLVRAGDDGGFHHLRVLVEHFLDPREEFVGPNEKIRWS